MNPDKLSETVDFLWLELTGKCNLECIHCYADSSPQSPMNQRMRLDDWKEVLFDACNLGCRKVQFIGGEPTLHLDLPELIEHARKLGYEFLEVFTNGTAFTAKIKEALLKHHVNLAFSVYSSNGFVHDSVTMRRGSHSKTVESLRWALKSGLQARVAIVDVGINSETIEHTSKILRELGVGEVRVDRNRGIGRGALKTNSDSVMDELCGQCWQGKLCVTPSGEIFPCVFSRFYPVGHIDAGLAGVVKSDRLINFRARLKSLAEEVAASSCDPQCGPDCSPAECNPQSDCNPNSQADRPS